MITQCTFIGMLSYFFFLLFGVYMNLKQCNILITECDKILKLYNKVFISIEIPSLYVPYTYGLVCYFSDKKRYLEEWIGHYYECAKAKADINYYSLYSDKISKRRIETRESHYELHNKLKSQILKILKEQYHVS